MLGSWVRVPQGSQIEILSYTDIYESKMSQNTIVGHDNEFVEIEIWVGEI